ncbi:hypothetical protein ACFL1A_03545, partial [Patescibacteria group bacterium]
FYIDIQANELIKSKNNIFSLLYLFIYNFINLFFGGYFRGKGFLDGWIGLQAHLIFASATSYSYLYAAYLTIMGKEKEFIKQMTK